ncbi:MAG: ABC transporter substrate-binding protein [Candidatus Bathyarchaeia archaeon]
MLSRRAITKIQAAIAIIVVLAIIVAGAAYYYYAAAPPAPAVKEIRIGLLYPISGAMAPLGNEQCEGTKMAIDMINERGGVEGYKIKYVVADAKSDPKVAVSEAERLCTIEKVPIIIGTYASPLLLAASEVAEKYKTVYWEVGAITDAATKRGYKYLLRIQVIGGDFGIVSGRFIAEVVAPKLGVDVKSLRTAIIFEDGPYGSSVADYNKKTCERFGIPIVLFEGYKAAATDLSYLITKLKDAKPDVILATSYYTDTVLSFRQAKELGLKFKVFIGHGAGHGLPDTYKTLGEDITYIFNPDPPPPAGINPEAIKPELRPILKEYIDRWKAKFGRLPLTHSHMGFSHTWVLLTEVLPKVIKEYKEVTPDNIVKAAYAIDIPEGGTTMGYGVKFSTPDKPADTIMGDWFGRGDKHVGQNIRAMPMVMQWVPGGELYNAYPTKYALKPPVIPLPPTSPYAAT